MRLKLIIRNALLLIIILCNIGCDQISKTIVRQNIDYNDRIDLIDTHLTLTKIENTGAFLSLGESLPTSIKFVLLNLFPLIVLAFGIYIVLSRTDIKLPSIIGICFVIGGGIGNLYDRIIYGSVTDFLHMDFVIFQTGIFNLADVSIMVGMFMILIYSYKETTKAETLQTD